MKSATKTAECGRCKAGIRLVRFGLHFKWVAGARDDWHCQANAQFPVRSHYPQEGTITDVRQAVHAG